MSSLPEHVIKRMDPVTIKALELLTWEWQPWEDLIAKIAPFVSPGKALRKYDQSRASYEKRRAESGGGDYRQREWTQEEKIESGKRALALVSMRSHTDSGRAEVDEVGGVKMVRLMRQVGHDGCCGGCGRPFSTGESLPSPESERETEIALSLARHPSSRTPPPSPTNIYYPHFGQRKTS